MSLNRISCSDSECEPLISSAWRNFQYLDLFSYSKLRVSQDDQKFKYWRNVLKRTVAAITALASRGLHLKRDYWDFCTFHKQWQNMTPSLQSKCPCTETPKNRHRLYLSSYACGQSMKLMLHIVLNTTGEEAWDTTYFSVNVDSVSGVSHLHQLTLIITYTKKINGPPNTL